MPSPEKLAHVVLRTGRVQEMTDWYLQLLDGKVAFANPMIAFITYDEEHHRLAFLATGASEPPEDRHTGLHHVAFTYSSLRGLLDNYLRLKDQGLLPFGVSITVPRCRCTTGIRTAIRLSSRSTA